MPDLNLVLDAETLRALSQELERDQMRGRLRLGAGSSHVLDGGTGDPGRNSLVSTLKDKLGPYIDFETGGLKLLEVPIGGEQATFSVVPGWKAGPEGGARGMGGPSITLKFHVKF